MPRRPTKRQSTRHKEVERRRDERLLLKYVNNKLHERGQKAVKSLHFRWVARATPPLSMVVSLVNGTQIAQAIKNVEGGMGLAVDHLLTAIEAAGV